MTRMHHPGRWLGGLLLWPLLAIAQAAAAPPDYPPPAWLGDAPRLATELAAPPLTFDRVTRIALLSAPGLWDAYRAHGISPAQLARLPHWRDAAPLSVRRDVLGLDAAPLARAQLTEAVLAQVAAARLDWLRLALADQQLALCRQQQQAAQAALTLMQAQYRAGNAAEDKLLPVQLAARRADADVLDCRASAAAARRDLAQRLGLPPGSALAAAPLPELPAILPAQDAIAALAAQSPAARLRAQALATEAKLLPARGATRGVSLPLLHGFDAEAMPPVSGEQLAAWRAEQEADAQLAAEYAGLTLARQRYALLAEQLPDARRYTRVMLTHYNGMLGSVYELIAARAAEFALQRELLEQQAAFWQHWLALDARLAGALESDFPQSAPSSPVATPAATHKEHDHAAP
ncbi:hypothetical protein [Chitinilyticum litopenaei]|uniref:hypothetical protein n=1 Tax=Chitinilyticum litopenaei TaxID=1121276 RepID=UPI00040B77D5|nr:hypothetical protein [Chitinilyticum litopenaei]